MAGRGQVLILVDEHDRALGYASREVCHSGRGKRHRAFVTILLNGKNQILLQRRKHALFDGLWDLTAISHPQHLKGRDETYQQASDRALKREMGISHTPINNIGGFTYFARDGQNCENEYCAVLVGNFEGKFQPNKDEIYETKWVNFADFIADTGKTPKKYTIWAQKGAEIFENSCCDDFLADLGEFTNVFNKYSKAYFAKKKKLSKKYPRLILDFYKNLEDFGSRGRVLRPYLVWLGYRVSQSRKPKSHSLKKILPVCLAFELVHSFFLIQDDVIDESDKRRGKLTIHKRYEAKYGPPTSLRTRKHYGEGMAMMLSDIALLEAFELVNQSSFEAQTKLLIWEKLLDVAKTTVYGEALDLEYSFAGSDLETVLLVADLKTARYSFVGPLVVGAQMSGAAESRVDLLSQYGLLCGSAFQIKDDILGVFGDEKVMGKSNLSDMREGKDTILFYKAMELSKGRDKEYLKKVWGNNMSDKSHLLKVRGIMEGSGALDFSRAWLDELAKRAKKMVSRITRDAQLASIMAQVATFVIYRAK